MVTKPSGFLFLPPGSLTAPQTAFPFSKAFGGPLSRRRDFDPKAVSLAANLLSSYFPFRMTSPIPSSPLRYDLNRVCDFGLQSV
jgi:hypothetical protein